MTSSLLWRGGGRIFPEHAGRELHAEDQQEDVPRWYGFDLLSAGARRPSRCRGFPVRGFASTPVPDKFKAMNLNSVLVIADVVDENLYLASTTREHPRG
jgi:large subunit ribosomal protein L4